MVLMKDAMRFEARYLALIDKLGALISYYYLRDGLRVSSAADAKHGRRAETCLPAQWLIVA